MSDKTPKSPGSPSASKAVLALKANFLQEIVEFLDSNNTLKFLTEIPKIHQSQELRNGRGPPDLKIEKEIVDLLTKPGAEKLQTKFTVACLTAIKGSFYKPNGRAALNSLLHSAKLFGNRTAFSQKIDRDFVSVAWHYLLDNRISLEEMEGLLNAWDAGKASELVYNFSAFEAKNRQPSGGSDSPVSSSKRQIPLSIVETSQKLFKDVTCLMLFSFDVFPVVQLIDVNVALIDRCIQELLIENPNVALRYVRIYPAKISLEMYNTMLMTQLKVSRDDGWELISQSISQIYDLKEHYTAEIAGTPSALVQTLAEHSLLSVSLREYTDFMQSCLQRALSSGTTNSMRSAVAIAEKIGRPDLLQETKRLAKLHKLRQFVVKDKWQLASQLYKDLQTKILLHEILIEQGKYAEAKRFAEEDNLHAHVRAVDPQMVKQQLLMEGMMYLPFPEKEVPVTMVDTLGKLFTLATRLGLSLDTEADVTDTADVTPSSSIPTTDSPIDGNDADSMQANAALATRKWKQIDDPSRKYITLQDMLAETMSSLSLTDTSTPGSPPSEARNPSTIPRTTTDNTDIQPKNIGSKRAMANQQTPPSSSSSSSISIATNPPVPRSPPPISYAQKVRGAGASPSTAAASAAAAVVAPPSSASATPAAVAATSSPAVATATVEASIPPPKLSYASAASGRDAASTTEPPTPSATAVVVNGASSANEVTTTTATTADSTTDVELTNSVSSGAIAAGEHWPFRHMVGIDIEWQPEVYRRGDSDAASIVQLALHDHVYILDLSTLSAYNRNGTNATQIDLQLKTVATFLRRMFNDPNILKIVFSFNNSDESVLQRVPGGFLKGVSSNARHIFDLQRDYVALAQQFSVNHTALNSLSDFCEIFLGKPLNKGERMSGWNDRPLTRNQLNYAALDAHSLLAILDVLLLRSGVDLGLHIFTRLYEANLKAAATTAASSSSNNEPNPTGSSPAPFSGSSSASAAGSGSTKASGSTKSNPGNLGAWRRNDGNNESSTLDERNNGSGSSVVVNGGGGGENGGSVVGRADAVVDAIEVRSISDNTSAPAVTSNKTVPMSSGGPTPTPSLHSQSLPAEIPRGVVVPSMSTDGNVLSPAPTTTMHAMPTYMMPNDPRQLQHASYAPGSQPIMYYTPQMYYPAVPPPMGLHPSTMVPGFHPANAPPMMAGGGGGSDGGGGGVGGQPMDGESSRANDATAPVLPPTAMMPTMVPVMFYSTAAPPPGSYPVVPPTMENTYANGGYSSWAWQQHFAQSSPPSSMPPPPPPVHTPSSTSTVPPAPSLPLPTPYAAKSAPPPASHKHKAPSPRYHKPTTQNRLPIAPTLSSFNSGEENTSGGHSSGGIGGSSGGSGSGSYKRSNSRGKQRPMGGGGYGSGGSNSHSHSSGSGSGSSGVHRGSATELASSASVGAASANLILSEMKVAMQQTGKRGSRLPPPTAPSMFANASAFVSAASSTGGSTQQPPSSSAALFGGRRDQA